MNVLAGMYAGLVEDCRQVLIALTERVEDSFGVAKDEVTEERIEEADSVLVALRTAAYLAGIGDKPL